MLGLEEKDVEQIEVFIVIRKKPMPVRNPSRQEQES
jgi:hypothetical protein